ncbi:hypothetical protein B0H19DRAFT_1183281 [Mycena capillaripes]|nr:hypothetical protein B0H19DRAFT_1183281 [Mycena capillaripes]
MDILAVFVIVAVGALRLISSLGLVCIITMPFVGVLVRYRANYTPKQGAVRLSLEDEAGDASPSDSKKSLSYFGMMRRVYRIEGWAGLYKGLMPSILTGLIALVVDVPISVVLSFYPPRQFGLIATVVIRWTVGFALAALAAVVLVPMQIITNRAITTPYKLPAFSTLPALRILLSPAECAEPLRLYLTPGVALAAALSALVNPALLILRDIAVYSAPRGPVLGATIPTTLLLIAFMTPLQVLTARLTLQRRGPETPLPVSTISPPSSDTLPADADPAATVPHTYSAEPVMHFRPTDESPYTSLLDCARKVIAEEGWGVLARAWWLTAIGMLLPLAPVLTAPRRF